MNKYKITTIALVITLLLSIITKHEANKLNTSKLNEKEKIIQNKDKQIQDIEQIKEEEKERQQKEVQKLQDELVKEREEHKKEIDRMKKKYKPPSRSRQVGNRVLLGTFEATAYTDNRKSQGKWLGQTATGVKPRVGIIAVDPNVIPLGTKLYVEGYGNCIAGDTGGAIKGNRVDLFLNSESECKAYGRKHIKVFKRNQ